MSIVLCRTMIAIGMLLLASQGAIWLEIGKISGKLDQISTKLDAAIGQPR